MGDETVRTTGTHERPQLLAGPRAVDVRPRDRVKARVPVPLVLVAAPRRRRKGKRPPVSADALAPVGAQDGLSLYPPDQSRRTRGRGLRPWPAGRPPRRAGPSGAGRAARGAGHGREGPRESVDPGSAGEVVVGHRHAIV